MPGKKSGSKGWAENLVALSSGWTSLVWPNEPVREARGRGEELAVCAELPSGLKRIDLSKSS